MIGLPATAGATAPALAAPTCRREVPGLARSKDRWNMSITEADLIQARDAALRCLSSLWLGKLELTHAFAEFRRAGDGSCLDDLQGRIAAVFVGLGDDRRRLAEALGPVHDALLVARVKTGMTEPHLVGAVPCPTAARAVYESAFQMGGLAIDASAPDGLVPAWVASEPGFAAAVDPLPLERRASYYKRLGELLATWRLPAIENLRTAVEMETAAAIASLPSPTPGARRSDARADQEARLVRAISTLGLDAKPDEVITEAHVNRQAGREILRELAARGEYFGYTR